MTAAKPDLLKRFLAVLIDGLLAGAVGFVFGLMGSFVGGFGTLLGAAYILTRDGLETPYTDGRSVGKRVIGLRPTRLDGAPMTLETSVRRNWTLALPSVVLGVGSMLLGLGPLALVGVPVILVGSLLSLLSLVEGVLVVTDAEGRRIGDKTAGTKVVEAPAAALA